MHREKLVEYDANARTVTLSPTGMDYVEGNLRGVGPQVRSDALQT